MTAQRKSLRLIAEHGESGKVLDGGPAKCKAIDRQTFEQLEMRLGGVAGVRRYAKSTGSGIGTFMEADWVATDHALYYVNFNAGSTVRWGWEDIKDLSVTGSGMLGATKRVTVDNGMSPVEMSMGKVAAKSLLSIAEGKLRNRDGAGEGSEPH